MATAITANRGLVFWAPRLLTMAYVAFLGLFALDVSDGNQSFRQTLLALLIHLGPSFILLAVLVVAWRREWIAAVIFGIFAIGYVLGPLAPPPVRHFGFSQRLMVDLVIAGPAFVIAALFLAGWLRRLRGAEPAR